MGVVIPNIIAILKEQNLKIRKLVFWDNCKSSGHCYIESVYQLARLSNGYCSAGEKISEKDDKKFQELIFQLENIDTAENKDELLQLANKELRMQNRILKHLTQCKHCTNHKNCDAEDELVRKQAAEMFCCVGSGKDDRKNDCNSL